LDQSSLRIEIRANSLEVTDDIKSKDRREIESTMNEKVLESAKYPSIVFQSNRTTSKPLGEGRYHTNIDGNLSFRGLSGDVSMSALIWWTSNMLRASGEFSLLQSEYDIPPVSVAGGALKLKDELKFAFDIVARREEQR